MRGQGFGHLGASGLPAGYGSPGYGRLGVASSYYTAALPFTPGMPPGGQRQRTWAFGNLPFGQAISYGAEPQGAPSQQSYYEQAGQFVGSYTAAADVRRALEKKQADLQALQQLKMKQPWMSSVLDWQISRVQADMTALQQKLALQLEGEDSTRTWRSLGQTGAGIAIVGGVIGVGILATILGKASRKTNPRRRNRGRR